MKIKNPAPSPLAMEYSAKKKLNAQGNKSRNPRTNARQTDTVALSSGQTDNLSLTAVPQASKPVTFEEQQLLSSTFSVQA